MYSVIRATEGGMLMVRGTKSPKLKGKRNQNGWVQNPNKRRGKGRFAQVTKKKKK